MSRLILVLAVAMSFAIGPVRAGDVHATAVDYGIPSNVTVASGETHRYEGRDTLDNNGNVTFNSGSVGLLTAGSSITLFPGFHAKAGSDVRAFIDSNFNGISDYKESLDVDDDGYYDELEAILGTSSEIGVVGYETDIDGDGIFDKIVDVAHGGTTSNYVAGTFLGYQGSLLSEYEVFGFYNYYPVYYSGMGFGLIFHELPSYLSINFYVTYSHFDLIGFYYNTYFDTEAGVEYELQTYKPGTGWQAVQRITGNGVTKSIDLPALYPRLEKIVDFVRLVLIGKIVRGDGGGSTPSSNTDSLSIERVGKVVDDNKIEIKNIPEQLSIPDVDDAANVDWGDKRIYSPNSTPQPWEIDMNGNGSTDITLDPINQSGRVSVPILGKTVEITYENGATSIGLGKYKLTRLPDGTLTIELPDGFTHGDGNIKIVILPEQEILIDADPGMIHLGFDPPNEEENEPIDVYWASVIKGQTSGILNLKMSSGISPEDLEFRLKQGDELFVDIQPKTFTNSETDLVLTGKTPGISGVYESTIELVDTASDDEVVLTLNVMVLPPRSIPLAIYSLSDPSSSNTAVSGFPSVQDFLNVCNDVYKQAGIVFTAHSSSGTRSFPYDTRGFASVPSPTYDQNAANRNANGHFDENELQAMFSPFGPTVPADDLFPLLPLRSNVGLGYFIINRVGIPYSGNGPPYVRGGATGWLGFQNMAQAQHLKLAVAHEIGHALGLSVQDDDEGGGHDLPPYPYPVNFDNPNGATPVKPPNAYGGTAYKLTPERAILTSGSPTITGLLPWLFGRWMTHEDWAEANSKAANY